MVQYSCTSAQKGCYTPIDDLTQFWIRESGFSLEFSKVKKLDRLSKGEQLFAAILRGDRETALKLLGDDRAAAELLEHVKGSNFSRLIIDRFYELKLADVVGKSLHAAISSLSAKEMAMQRFNEKQFAEVLSILSRFKTHLVWIRGVSLARSIYPQVYYRHPGDFDVVVHQSVVTEVLETLDRASFSRVNFPGFCNQNGVGPIGLEDLFLAPAGGFIPSSALAMGGAHWPSIDIKVGPLDRGVQMCEIERFFADAQFLTCKSEQFLAPSTVDHLIICLHNFEKDRFKSWKNLFDIHLLANEVSRSNLWQELVERCKRESLNSSVWAGLALARDRLQTPVPDWVFNQVGAKKSLLKMLTTYTVSPYFVWNATSLPMMVLNATVSGDRERKFSLLKGSIFPSKEFLSRYYNDGRMMTPAHALACLFMHWLVLILPGGMVRRTLGRCLWLTKQRASASPDADAGSIQ